MDLRRRRKFGVILDQPPRRKFDVILDQPQCGAIQNPF